MDKKEKILNKIKDDLDSLTTINEEDEESEKDKVLKLLMDKKDIGLKTELSDQEIMEISKLLVIADRIESDALKQFLKTFQLLRVSKQRQGRKEIIASLKDEESRDKMGFFANFMDGFNRR